MKSSKIFILVLVCVSAFAQTNSCPSFNAGDLLQSGKNSFIKSGRTSQYTFDAPISFPIPSRGLQLAVTAATIGDYNPSQGGFSFNINGRRRGNSGFVQFSVIVNSDNSWSSIQVSWFASARQDFAVANVQYPVNQWIRGSGSDTYDLVSTLNKYLPEGNYKVAAFISGFSTSDNQFQISINQRSYDSWNRKVTITFYCGAYPQPNTVTVSYIVYPEQHAQLQISYEVSPRGESGAYQITGPVNFNNNNIQYNEFRIASRFYACTGNQCSNTCILRQQCVELNGNAYEGQCVFCAPGIVFEYGQCTRRCGANQLYTNRVCVCLSGFVRRGNACVAQGSGGNNDRCKKDQIVWNNQCRRCPQESNANPGQNTCNCRQGLTYDPQSNNCYSPQPTCQYGQQWNGNRCICIANWGRYNNQCRQCPQGSTSNNNQQCICSTGYTYDPQSNTCIFNQPSCGPNRRWDGQRCVCNPGLIDFNGQCRACPNNAQPNYQANTCNCPNNFRYDAQGNQCLPVNNCPDTFQWDGFRCRCPNNYISWNNRCRACPSNSRASRDQTTCNCDNNWQFDGLNNRCVNPCGSNQVASGNGCVCVNNFYRYNNGPCKACPSGSRANPAQTTCVCDRFDQTFDQINNRCVIKNNCGANQVVGNNGQCVCVAGSVRYQNGCRPCPTNSKANQNTNTCECQSGFTFDAAKNTCVARCGLSQVWKNNRCECIVGYSWWGQACRSCPTSAKPSTDQRTCVCTSSTAIYIADTNICLQCGANASPNAQRTACQCNPGFFLKDNQCISQIQCEFNQDLINGACVCKFGWLQLGPTCVQRCGANQYWDSNNCLCKQGHAKMNGACRFCPAGTVPNNDKTTCLCNDPRAVYIPNRNVCQACPVNSAPNADDTDCVCYAGYTKQQNGQCVSNCPADATPDASGACVCSGGKFWGNNQCNQPSVCPDRSTFNQQTFTCVCNDRRQNIIGGVCKPCGQNSVWNNGQCVCSTGFFLIGGVCRSCDPRSKHDGTDCICQLGYFGNRDLCTPCHKSCSKCTGPQANQCQSCSDVALVLKDGYCIKNSPCNYGFFLQGSTCSKCTDNCIDCDNTFECRTCAIGYRQKSLTVAGQNVVSCQQICGDGIKYQQQCDDGNTKSGDGCSATCQEQPGWFCSGGSSNKPSVCRKYIPDRVQLSSKGAVNLGGQVILSVRASYLPSCITKNQCAECFKVIQANVVNVNVPVLVVISYVPFSQWQFYIKFDFQGLYVSSIFKVVIKLNDAYKGCIAAQDYDQQLELTIDPAFLAKVDKNEQLKLDDLNPGNSNANPPVDLPQAALAILGRG